MDSVNYRVRWERHQEQEKQKVEDEKEKERGLTSSHEIIRLDHTEFDSCHSMLLSYNPLLLLHPLFLQLTACV